MTMARAKRLLAGGLRVAALLSVLLAFVVARSVHAAERRAGEGLLGFGAALMKLGNFSADPERRLLTVNGVELELMTLSSPEDVAGALGRLRGLCQRGGVNIPDHLAMLGARDGSLAEGILQRTSEHEGVIACIDAGRRLGLEDLVEGLDRVRATGDLTALGALRFALARRSGNVTHVLVLWTRGSLELAKMFPAGDAPGHDPQGLPRPAGTRRLISAAAHEAPYGVTVYESKLAVAGALLEAYRAELGRAGWATQRGRAKDSLVALRDGRGVVLVAGRLGSGRTFLSVAELARQ